MFVGDLIPVKAVDGSTVEIEFTRELAAAVQEFVDYVNDLPAEEALIEVRVRYEEYVPGGFGTLDDARLNPGVAYITDLKAGRGVPVYAQDNEQLMLYALGILLEHDWIYNFQRFVLAIHQPRLDSVSKWEISREELLKWAKEVLVPGYEATLKPDAKFVPGSHCQFCKLEGTCRARTQAMFTVLTDEFTDVDAEFSVPAEITLDELAKIHRRFPELKSWMSAVKDRLVLAVMQGQKVEDVKLVAGKSARQFIGENKDVVKELVKAGLKKEDIYEEPEIKSVAQIEKLIPKGKARFAAAKDEKPAGDLAKLIRKIPGKPTLAHGEDPRPALTVDVLQEFDNLDTGDDE